MKVVEGTVCLCLCVLFGCFICLGYWLFCWDKEQLNISVNNGQSSGAGEGLKTESGEREGEALIDNNSS